MIDHAPGARSSNLEDRPRVTPSDSTYLGTADPHSCGGAQPVVRSRVPAFQWIAVPWQRDSDDSTCSDQSYPGVALVGLGRLLATGQSPIQ